MASLEQRHNERSTGELMASADRAARLMDQAETELAAIRRRFEEADDEGAKSELADEALARVEAQIEMMGERRRSLDRVEGKLWARRNRLERFLIGARGREWWNARRETVRRRALAPGPIGERT